jgi:hypothetical protein
MIVNKPDGGSDKSETVYVCDNCGGLSNFSDYWWPGHVHWDELNFTLCNDCLRLSGLQGKITPQPSGRVKLPPG